MKHNPFAQRPHHLMIVGKAEAEFTRLLREKSLIRQEGLRWLINQHQVNITALASQMIEDIGTQSVGLLVTEIQDYDLAVTDLYIAQFRHRETCLITRDMIEVILNDISDAIGRGSTSQYHAPPTGFLN